MLRLMYITNDMEIAKICDNAYVDRIFIDLEKLGKAERQKNWNSVQSDHKIEDIGKVKSVLKNSQILVRINPINENSKEEIDSVIAQNPNIIMLPYFKTADEVKQFIEYIGGRVRTSILLETREAVKGIDEILSVNGIDEVHIGLNDLSHSYEQPFLFAPFNHGIVDYVVQKIKEHGIKNYGIGGIAKIGYGKIPAEDVICEHYRLGSTCAILSRAFCNSEIVKNLDEVANIFSTEVSRIRRIENCVKQFDEEMFEYHRKRFNEKVESVTEELKRAVCE